MPDSDNVESLRVNGALVTDKEDMRRVVKEFWEEIGGVGEVFKVREGCVTVKGRHYLIRHASPQLRHRLCVPFEAPRFWTELEMEDRHGGGRENTLGLAVDAHLYHGLCSKLSQLLGVASDLEPCQTPPPPRQHVPPPETLRPRLVGLRASYAACWTPALPQPSALLVASGSAPDT